jgi:hypothetical protein
MTRRIAVDGERDTFDKVRDMYYEVEKDKHTMTEVTCITFWKVSSVVSEPRVGLMAIEAGATLRWWFRSNL